MRQVGVLAARRLRLRGGVDGQWPDAESAARDRYCSAEVQFVGHRRKVSNQQSRLLIGVRWSADRSKTTDGRVAPDTASSSPKSVSAEIITSPESAACAKIARSGAASMPISAT